MVESLFKRLGWSEITNDLSFEIKHGMIELCQIRKGDVIIDDYVYEYNLPMYQWMCLIDHENAFSVFKSFHFDLFMNDCDFIKFLIGELKDKAIELKDFFNTLEEYGHCFVNRNRANILLGV